MRANRLPLFFVLLLLGCGQRAHEGEPTEEPARPAEPAEEHVQTVVEEGAEEGSDPEGGEGEPREALAEATIRALVEAWLSAQNEGNFDAYSALYAERFTGLKRSGERERSYDRQGWLADRRQMFRRSMEVRAESVSVHASATEAVVHFTQRWSSATYQDVGLKRLVVVKEGDQLRIAREEMLSSEILGRQREGAAGLASIYPFVAIGRGAVVLAEEAEEGWSEGRPRLMDRGRIVSVARGARVAALPEALRALQGRSLRVYGAQGEVCTATVGALRVLRRIVPHFGTVQAWNGEEGTPPFSRAQVAADAWSAHGPGGGLMAELESSGSCRGGLYALPAEAPAPTVYRLRAALGAEETALLEATRQGAEHRALQRDSGEATPWDEREPRGQRLLQIAVAGERRVGLVELSAGNFCGDFGAHLLTALTPAGAGWSARTGVGAARALAAFDLEGDGSPELLVEQDDGTRRLLRLEGTRYRITRTLPVSNLDCDC